MTAVDGVRDRQRRLLPLMAWLAALAALLVALGHLDGGVLEPPALRAPSTWDDWAAARQPVEAAFALLRLVVVVLAWYLAGTTTVGLAARLLRLTPLVAAADVLTLPAVRRLLQGALGLGLATAALVAVRPGPRGLPAPPAVDVVTATAAASSAGPPEVMRQVDGDGSEAATMRRLPAGAAPEPAAGPVWTVAPGDHLWSIAEDTLAQAWGRPPSDREIVPFWRAVVEANRSSLADPENPDLIFPGQRFSVPPPPSR